ncbi:MAG: ribonuclease PH [Candidatus Lokiarchaeota archaeon]|nr:ribonuclease PH [Candidatus Lokiarchaeota archaeon]
MVRFDGRANNDLRPINLEGPNFIKYPKGSVLISMGNTRVLCNVSISDRVPPFLNGKGQGWLTAEYNMLPASTHVRREREGRRTSHISGRTQEISRMIGRALRGVVDLEALGERSIYIDCDVLQADGGTRCASINGAFIAVKAAIISLMEDKMILNNPISENIGAISLGYVDGELLIDLNYEEDSKAEVDLNIVMTESKKIIEIQGTAENKPFMVNELNEMIEVAYDNIIKIIDIQKNFI